MGFIYKIKCNKSKNEFIGAMNRPLIDEVLASLKKETPRSTELQKYIINSPYFELEVLEADIKKENLKKRKEVWIFKKPTN